MTTPHGPSDGWIAALPKCELHVHLEGTFESQPPRAGDFPGLAAFLADYYQAMDDLTSADDFYRLTAAYLSKAAGEGVRRAEMFFDPQAHTRRGVPFGDVVAGIDQARRDALAAGGVETALIMCFLRDESARSALATLDEALPWRSMIDGVGLDSDERGNPPSKFAEVFGAARAAGFRLTAHCDPGQPDALNNLWECMDLVGVERIDHGVDCVRDSRLVEVLRAKRIGLTACPLSNLRLYGDSRAGDIRAMLDQGLLVTVNSDDPAYFGGYVAANYRLLRDQAGFGAAELTLLARNSFHAAWIDPARRAGHLRDLDAYLSPDPPGPAPLDQAVPPSASA